MPRESFHDPVLGELRYEPEYSWYEGECTLGKDSVSLRISVRGDDAEKPAALASAREVRANLEELAARAKECAVEELLGLKNKAWLQEGEDPVGAPEFKRRMRLESVVAHPDGAVDFWHWDGELFWGHGIRVRRNTGGEFDYAEISG